MSQCDTNASAIQQTDQRIADLNAFQKQIEARETQGRLPTNELSKLRKLKQQTQDSQNALAKERELRQSVEEAYDDSEYANPDKDPKVNSAFKKLQQYQKSKGNQKLHGSDRAVDNPCVPCMQQKFAALKDCDKVYWVDTKYGSGPSYPTGCNQHTLALFDGWDDLIASGQKTASEKDVLTTMSSNEGAMDAVQGWDDQVLSVGAMQKTLRPDGGGELVDQLSRFKKSDPDKYKELFEDKGWTVEDVTVPPKKKGGKSATKEKILFKDPGNKDAKKLTGEDLKDYIDEPDDPDRWNRAFGPWHKAGQDPAFQRQQVCDFNSRLKNSMSKTPPDYDYPINSYITSQKGAAMVIDQDVNRPGYVAEDFSYALDNFYEKHPKAPKDPSDWTDQERAQYEPEIVSSYRVNRRTVETKKLVENNRKKEKPVPLDDLEDVDNRGNAIMDSDLSSKPGSLQWPERPGCGS